MTAVKTHARDALLRVEGSFVNVEAHVSVVRGSGGEWKGVLSRERGVLKACTADVEARF